ncbi:MAG: DUF5320 domain-containing protein [Nanoarchaeota archaeon]|nr:DUF5320 domain-containing protein [Nanoarchaeota archaeon]
MPNGDKTGPQGEGPKTGRGLGLCSGSNEPGWKSTEPKLGRNQNSSGRGQGRGFGRGQGRGFGRGAGLIRSKFVEFTAEEKRKVLEAEKEQIEKELKEL